MTNNHELIKRITSDFSVQGNSIPVKYLYYHGSGEPYIVWMQETMDGSISGDDELLGVVEYYDFDVYSRGNYLEIQEKLIDLLKGYGFTYQPARSSADQYETDTRYYHKTLSFAILTSYCDGEISQ